MKTQYQCSMVTADTRKGVTRCETKTNRVYIVDGAIRRHLCDDHAGEIRHRGRLIRESSDE